VNNQMKLMVQNRVVSAWVATALGFLVFVSASPAWAGSTDELIGEWNATITLDDGTVETDAHLSFREDGELVTLSATGQGIGTWQREGGRTVSYTTRTDTDFGYLIISAQVEVSCKTYSGTGLGTAYDHEGNVLGSQNSVVVATKGGRQ
jgi:hypothetical protein